MRKLRRLPWRIPKSHSRQPADNAPAVHEAHVDYEPSAAPAHSASSSSSSSSSYRDLNTQPVAFSGGRYVYGDAPSVASPTEIRRKTRHRIVLNTLTPQQA